MGRVKTVQASTGTSAGTVTGIDGTTTAKSANYTVTDTDLIRSILMTTGSTTFTFVDADVSTGSDTITKSSHGYSDGQAVYLTTTGVLPTGLSTNLTYFMVSTATNTFKLALTVGGSAIDITAAAGGGTHTVTICKTVTLPTAADNTNRVITIKKVDSGTGFTVIDGEGSETIDGSTYISLASQYEFVTLVCDGTGWDIAAINRAANGTYAGALPAVGSMSDALATQLGMKQYYAGTNYAAGISPTVTNNKTSPATTRAVFVPYQMQDGAWRLKFNISTTFTSATVTQVIITINGVLFKNVSNAYQPVAGMLVAGGIGNITQCYADPNTANIVVTYTSSTTATMVCASGDCELNAKPSWAY